MVEVEKRGHHVRTGIGILVAVAFSVLYAGLYPLLIGGFVIYFYPYWRPALPRHMSRAAPCCRQESAIAGEPLSRGVVCSYRPWPASDT
jgi:hypothetical protein